MAPYVPFILGFNPDVLVPLTNDRRNGMTQGMRTSGLKPNINGTFPFPPDSLSFFPLLALAFLFSPKKRERKASQRESGKRELNEWEREHVSHPLKVSSSLSFKRSLVITRHTR